jgi:hypothetical protein
MNPPASRLHRFTLIKAVIFLISPLIMCGACIEQSCCIASLVGVPPEILIPEDFAIFKKKTAWNVIDYVFQ